MAAPSVHARRSLIEGALATLRDPEARKSIAMQTASIALDGGTGSMRITAEPSPEAVTTMIARLEEADSRADYDQTAERKCPKCGVTSKRKRCVCGHRIEESGAAMMAAAGSSYALADDDDDGGSGLWFDPSKHPRDRRGRFIEILNSLTSIGGILDDDANSGSVELPDGSVVERSTFGKHFIVYDRKGRRIKVKTAEQAADALNIKEAVATDPPQKLPRTPEARAHRALAKRGAKRAAGGEEDAAPNQEGEDPDFEKLHPRGSGGVWIKKNQGMASDKGDAQVAKAQRRLHQLGFAPGAPDGKNGPLTQAAISKLQAAYGLQQTGEVDPATYQTMIDPPAKTVPEVQAENRALAAMPNAQGEVPHAGAAAGAAPGAQAATPAAGGSATTLDTADQNAVMQFQKAKGLKVDGVVGPETTTAMHAAKVDSADGSVSSAGQVTQPVSTTTTRNPDGTTTSTTSTSGAAAPGASPTAGGGTATSGAATKKQQADKKNVIGKGDGTPEQVKTIQTALEALGYDLGEGGVDGRYGDVTVAAVKKLQREHGLTADGKVGKRTQRLMKRLLQREKTTAGAKNKVKSGDEIAEAVRIPVLRRALAEARDEFDYAEETGSGTRAMYWRTVMDVYRTKLEEAHVDPDEQIEEGILSHLPTWNPRKHPRGRGGRFRDSLDFGAMAAMTIPHLDMPGDLPNPKTESEVKAETPSKARAMLGKVVAVKPGNSPVTMIGRVVSATDRLVRVRAIGGDNHGAISKHDIADLTLFPRGKVSQSQAQTTNNAPGSMGAVPHLEGKRPSKSKRQVPLAGPKEGARAQVKRYRSEYEDYMKQGRHDEAHRSLAKHDEILLKLRRRRSVNEALHERFERVSEQRGDASDTDEFTRLRAEEMELARRVVAEANFSALGWSEARAVVMVAPDRQQVAAARKALTEWESWVDHNVGELELTEAADSLAKASTHKSLERVPGKNNWIEKTKTGQLPAYITQIADSIHKKRGVPLSQAIAIAIGTVKRWARGGGDVDANTRAAAAKAVAEWEKLKAENKARKAAS